MPKSTKKGTPKKETPARLKKKLWQVFSRYIRERDGHICFTCGKTTADKRYMQAGHMIPRAAGGLSLYFHERNVHCQCYHCNINLGGNGAVYAHKFIERYGQPAFDELMALKNTGFLKYSVEDYKHLIGVYERKLKEIQV